MTNDHEEIMSLRLRKDQKQKPVFQIEGQRKQ